MVGKNIRTQHGKLPLWVEEPRGTGPFAGVVVLHDAMGMTTDLRNQAKWLADAGFVAAAPDLYSFGGTFGCLFHVVRDAMRGSGRVFDEIEATRQYLLSREDSNGAVGLIGFCMGGGFALLLAPRRYGFGAASANYGALPKDAEVRLASACPIVGSYGARDSSLRGAAERLAGILDAANVPNDIKEYPDAGHSFLNDHDISEVPWIFRIMGHLVGGTAYHEPSAADARARIAAFFRSHLQPGDADTHEIPPSPGR